MHLFNMEKKYYNNISYIKEKCIQIYKEYVNKLKYIYIQKKSESKSIKYSSGSNLHLGYYCPSLVVDITVGGCHRGLLLKKDKKTKRTTHKYYFDKDNKLIMVREYIENLNGIDEIGILFYEVNKISEITFQVDKNNNYISNSINNISMYIYENENITQYYDIYGYEYNNTYKINSVRAELYQYDKSNSYVGKAIFSDFLNSNKPLQSFIASYYLDNNDKLVCDNDSIKWFY